MTLQRNYFLFLILFVFQLAIAHCQSFKSQIEKENSQIGLQIKFSPEALSTLDNKEDKIQNLFMISPKLRLQQGQQSKKLQEQQFKNIQISNLGQNKRRMLKSNGNQFPQIDEGNNYQVTMGNYVISLRSFSLTIHKVEKLKLQKIASIDFPANDYYPQALHAQNGYFSVVLSKYSAEESITIIKVYQLENSNIVQQRQYRKRGVYKSSKQYNSFVLYLLQDQIKTSNVSYYWLLSDKGQINQTIYQGAGANSSSTYIGSYVRIFVKVPLASQNNTAYKFATFLFCDYAWDFMISPYLNVFVFSNYYQQTKNSYFASIQSFSFAEIVEKTWGLSRWVVYPGAIYSSYQLQQYNGYFRFVIVLSFGAWGTVGSVSVVKIPMKNFDLKQAYIQKNLGVQQQSLMAAIWRKSEVFLLSRDGTIKTYSSQLRKVTQVFKIHDYLLSMLYPYGSINMIGIGYSSTNPRYIIISYFQVNNRKLIFKQSLSFISSNKTQFPYQYSSVTWYDTKQVQIDWKNKRMTFKIFSTESQPYGNGYLQAYINPLQNCISAIPAPNPCPSGQNQTTSLIGHIVKQWDNTIDYDYNTGSSNGILTSTTIESNNSQILITASSCQLQSRIIQDPYKPISNDSSIVWYQDLCP